VAGEGICQDGFASFNGGHGVPCNIKVQGYTHWISCELYSPYSCYSTLGWWGESTNGNPVVTEGDSGSVVFCYCGGNRKAIGLTSLITKDFQNAFVLNPHK
jgi:hypothetical protein